jgi:hypothetical protein
MGVISVFRWTGCEEILLGFWIQLLDRMRVAAPRNLREKECLHILSTTRQKERIQFQQYCGPLV